jgi:hypothetical protein
MSGYPCGGWYPMADGKILRDCPDGEIMRRYKTPEAAIFAAARIVRKQARANKETV